MADTSKYTTENKISDQQVERVLLLSRCLAHRLGMVYTDERPQRDNQAKIDQIYGGSLFVYIGSSHLELRAAGTPQQ